jgi:hypothetical protein
VAFALAAVHRFDLVAYSATSQLWLRSQRLFKKLVTKPPDLVRVLAKWDGRSDHVAMLDDVGALCRSDRFEKRSDGTKQRRYFIASWGT